MRGAVASAVRRRRRADRPGVLETVPAAKSSRQARVPSVWDPADVTKVVGGDRSRQPVREARLRDRPADLPARVAWRRRQTLQFADLDWPGNRVSVVQAKTGQRVWLPLLKDVGWAIIDYVRDGRPASDCPQVFLRHTAPIGPFSDQTICTRSWSSTPASRACALGESVVAGCTRSDTRSRPG